MTETGRVSRAARRAIARAKRRGSDAVTPDDLLVGLLAEASRFGIALIGGWAIDVAELEGRGDGEGPAPQGPPAPAYAPETVRLFERGAALAREDGAVAIGLVHLLAAYADEKTELMDELRARHGFSSAEWRATLARGDVGPWRRLAGPRGDGTDGARPRGGHAPALLSVDDAAEYLGVHSQTVRNYIRSGKLPAYRLAGERYIRVLRKDLPALLERVGAQDPDD